MMDDYGTTTLSEAERIDWQRAARILVGTHPTLAARVQALAERDFLSVDAYATAREAISRWAFPV